MYGIKKHDLKYIQKKHELQRKYLEDQFFVGSSGQVKTLLDVSFSANHSKRYYSEIINKINTINEIIATELVEYSSIFITITLDGFFRDFLKGDFSRYNEIKYKKLIPNNERFGHLRDKIEKEEKFSIKDLYNVLNFQLNRFQKSSKYMSIKKQGFKPHYIRVAEPHKKDGVPHIHMMLYVPSIFKNDLLEVFKDYFPAPQNLKVLKGKTDGQINGFQWDIKSAPAYILKYLFKSFLDVENESELDELQAWYIKHRILRVVTSHSLVPAWVYRKVIPLEKDWHYLTDIKNNATFELSKEEDYFMFEDEYNRVLRYEKGVYQLFNNNKLIKQFGTRKEVEIEKPNRRIKLTYTNKKDPFVVIEGIKYKRAANKQLESIKSNPIVVIDDVEYISINGELKRRIKPVSKMSSYSLFKHYNNLNNQDIEYIDLKHYGLVKNELIKRKYLYGDVQNLNSYSSEFNINTFSKGMC